jgi:SOS-response transcriptional repressor LexA
MAKKAELGSLKGCRLFKVSGKSMEADSIYEGDFVVVDPAIKIVNHDIVVFRMPDFSTLVKHFYKKDKHQFFYPFDISQPKAMPGRMMDDAHIIGKVTAIISKHKQRRTK